MQLDACVPSLTALVSQGVASPVAPKKLRRSDEAHVSAKCSQAGEEARVPCSDVNPRRPPGHQEPPPQGASQAGCLISGISDRAVFAALRAEGQQVRSRDLRLRFLLGDGSSQPQVAYAISKKVGNAVVRNRMRRRLRVLFAEHLDEPSVVSLSAGLVIVMPSATKRSFPELHDQVVELMKKVEKSTISEAASS